MGEHHSNPRAKQFSGGAIDFKVGFKVLVKPSRTWDEANIDMTTGQMKPDMKPPEEADMRIAIMMCITEMVTSPLAQIPPKMVFHPCSIVYEENLEAFRINGMTPQEFQEKLNGIPTEATPAVVTDQSLATETPEE